jgi:hypothetical protein
MPALPNRELSLAEQKARAPKIVTAADVKKEEISSGRYFGFFAGIAVGECLFFSAMCTHPALLILPLVASIAGGEAVRHNASEKIKDRIHTFFCGKSGVVKTQSYVDGMPQQDLSKKKPF